MGKFFLFAISIKQNEKSPQKFSFNLNRNFISWIQISTLIKEKIQYRFNDISKAGILRIRSSDCVTQYFVILRILLTNLPPLALILKQKSINFHSHTEWNINEVSFCHFEIGGGVTVATSCRGGGDDYLSIHVLPDSPNRHSLFARKLLRISVWIGQLLFRLFCADDR